MYCLILGSAIALLGWALRGTRITHRLVDWSGVVLGIFTVGIATVSLVAGFGGGSDGNVLFDTATLLLPALYLWAMVLDADVSR